MFRRTLEEWFDSNSDGWNPITVRDVRRCVRSRFLLIVPLIHLALLASFYVLDTPEQGNSGEIILRVLPTYVAMLCVTLWTTATMVRSHMEDESLTAVPLTPTQHVHGYLGTSCVLSAFFLVQALPFFVFPTVLPHGRLIQLGFLIWFLIAAQMVTLFILPFFIRVTTIAEAVIAFFGASMIGLTLFGTLIQIMFITLLALLLMPLEQPDIQENSLSIVGAFIVFIGEISASFLFACLPYQLSLYLFANHSKRTS